MNNKNDVDNASSLEEKALDKNASSLLELNQVCEKLRDLLDAMPAVAEFKLSRIIKSLNQSRGSKASSRVCKPFELQLKEIKEVYKNFKMQPNPVTGRKLKRAQSALIKRPWGRLSSDRDIKLLCIEHLQAIADASADFDEMEQWMTYEKFKDVIEQARELLRREDQILSQIVNNNLKLVKAIALKYQPLHSLPLEEIEQLGIDSIKSAAYQFDTESSYRFTSFIYDKIKVSIHDHLSCGSHLNIEVQLSGKALEVYEKNMKEEKTKEFAEEFLSMRLTMKKLDMLSQFDGIGIIKNNPEIPFVEMIDALRLIKLDDLKALQEIFEVCEEDS